MKPVFTLPNFDCPGWVSCNPSETFAPRDEALFSDVQWICSVIVIQSVIAIRGPFRTNEIDFPRKVRSFRLQLDVRKLRDRSIYLKDLSNLDVRRIIIGAVCPFPGGSRMCTFLSRQSIKPSTAFMILRHDLQELRSGFSTLVFECQCRLNQR